MPNIRGLRAQTCILDDAPFQEAMAKLSEEWESLSPEKQESIINALIGDTDDSDN